MPSHLNLAAKLKYELAKENRQRSAKSEARREWHLLIILFALFLIAAFSLPFPKEKEVAKQVEPFQSFYGKSYRL